MADLETIMLLEQEATALRERLALVEARLAAQREPAASPPPAITDDEIPYLPAFLRGLLNHVPFGLSLRDRRGRYILFSRFLQQNMAGENAGTLRGNRPEDYLSDYLRPVLQEHLEQVLERRAPFTTIVHNHSPDEPRTSQVTFFPLLDDQGDVYAFGALSIDITKDTDYETALSESEQRFRSVWEVTPDAMVMSDVDGVVVSANPAYFDLYGLQPEEVIGKPFTNIYPEHDRARAMEGYRQVYTAGMSLQPFEAVVRRSDGTMLTVESRARFVQQADGRRLLLSTIRDISERKRNEEDRLQIERKLQETQRLEGLGVLAGGIAHDFNNILTSISGNAELALLDVEPDTPLYDSIISVIASARRAAELVSQIMAYAGQGRYTMNPLDLNDLIKQTNSLLQTSAGTTATISYQLEEGLPLIEGDITQLNQVLLNLVTNAAEAIDHADGQITVATSRIYLSPEQVGSYMFGAERDGGLFVALRISDNGRGIDQESIDRIFDPFYTTKFTGRGLGLAAVQGIVRGHSGLLQVTSIPDHGTQVQICFPATTAPAAFLSPVDAAPAPRRRTVMVVDDEEAVRLVAARLLARLGLATIAVSDGESALQRLRQGVPELIAVLCDLTMPRMHGDHLAREIYAILPDLPIILMSGYSTAEIERLHQDLPVSGFLQKPFSIERLREILTAI